MHIYPYAVALALFIPQLAFGEPPSRPIKTFGSAKKIARDAIYSDHKLDFYCGCDYTTPKKGSGGTINPSNCGYKPRKSAKRGARLEWEHVVPAYYFGSPRACWKNGSEKCVKPNGKKMPARDCCSTIDSTFRQIEADLHNLVPAVGELNGDRSNLQYGIVEGEPRTYGRCDFEIGGKPKLTEPIDDVRGDAGRIWLYMSDTYGISISDKQRKMFEEWSEADPVDDWERLRNIRIEAAQGNRNSYVE